METKTCYKCKKELLLSNFKSHSKRKDGLQAQCVECQKKYRREHYLKNRKKYIEKASVHKQKMVDWWREYKKQFSCITCGETHSACIEFHHVSNNKEECVARLITNGNKKRILKEIEKCVPLCSNCHKKLHWKEREDMRV